MHLRVLSLIAALSLIQPLLAVEPLEERAVLDAVPTPPIFQNPFSEEAPLAMPTMWASQTPRMEMTLQPDCTHAVIQ